MLPFSFVDRLRYVVERQFIKGAHYQLLVVAAFIALISLVGGWLVYPAVVRAISPTRSGGRFCA
ncbi:hypothetical protein ULG90_04195 [Halopseudomonas pachastrellae]|nr:hypothetical protein ULG90_04195 [Halopseudomonas pachastrellae]